MKRTEGPKGSAARWAARKAATGYFALAVAFVVWAFIWLAWAPKPYAWIATIMWFAIAVVFVYLGLRLRKAPPGDDDGETGEGGPGDGPEAGGGGAEGGEGDGGAHRDTSG
ncbi:hypothetical protein [Streptomyces sp. NBC_00344]|uniref:hypothetical protein n=1 Tax=Streptomyces sp. NBC_00344 TaxID=2975720 RepID=UPI002E1F62D8